MWPRPSPLIIGLKPQSIWGLVTMKYPEASVDNFLPITWITVKKLEVPVSNFLLNKHNHTFTTTQMLLKYKSTIYQLWSKLNSSITFAVWYRVIYTTHSRKHEWHELRTLIILTKSFTTNRKNKFYDFNLPHSFCPDLVNSPALSFVYHATAHARVICYSNVN